MHWAKSGSAATALYSSAGHQKPPGEQPDEPAELPEKAGLTQLKRKDETGRPARCALRTGCSMFKTFWNLPDASSLITGRGRHACLEHSGFLGRRHSSPGWAARIHAHSTAALSRLSSSSTRSGCPLGQRSACAPHRPLAAWPRHHAEAEPEVCTGLVRWCSGLQPRLIGVARRALLGNGCVASWAPPCWRQPWSGASPAQQRPRASHSPLASSRLPCRRCRCAALPAPPHV